MISLGNLGFTLRLLKKKAGFNVLCVIVIALGLSISVVDYYLVSATAFQDMPFPDGDRFSLLRTEAIRTDGAPVESAWDAYRYNYVKENAQSYSVLGAMYTYALGTLSDGETSVTPTTTRISPQLLHMTGVQPILGRSLTVSDDRSGANPVALISENLWQDYYRGRPDIVGTVARINGEARVIVGVMPADFKFPVAHDLWLPLQLSNVAEPEEIGNLTVAALLAEGISFDAASVELQNLLAPLSAQFPDIYEDYASDVKPYVVMGNAGAEAIVNSMLGAMVVIILLSCLNVGNLLLVRTNERHHELLIRAAVGASRWHLIRQVLQESFLICLLGGLIGIGLIYLSLNVISLFLWGSASPIDPPFWIQPSLDLGLLLVALGVLLLIWLLAGGIPAWKMSKIDPSLAQGAGGKGTTQQGGRGRVTNVLIGLELVTSVFFLILSGVLIVGIQQANNTDLGVEIANTLTARVDLLATDYATAELRQQYADDMKLQLENIPGVTSVSYATALPAQTGTFLPYILEEQEVVEESELPRQFVVSVADNYFQTMGVDLIEGRYFDFTDTLATLPVVIIDELFADALRTSSPREYSTLLGKRLRINPGVENEWLTIIGITSHIVQSQPTAGNDRRTTLYRPFEQRTSQRINFVIKSPTNPYEHTEQVQIAAAAVDRNIPVHRLMSLQDSFADNMTGLSLIGTVFVMLSSVTLVLAVSGVYAIIARSVLQRTRETGVRRALGATNLAAILMFVRKGFAYLAMATIVGGALAALASQGIALLFPDALSSLPMVFAAVVALFSIVIFIASYIPARSVVALEPGEALHYE